MEHSSSREAKSHCNHKTKWIPVAVRHKNTESWSDAISHVLTQQCYHLTHRKH